MCSACLKCRVRRLEWEAGWEMAFLGHTSSSADPLLVMLLILTAGSAAEAIRRNTLTGCPPSKWPPQAWIQARNFFGPMGIIFDLGQSPYEADEVLIGRWGLSISSFLAQFKWKCDVHTQWSLWRILRLPKGLRMSGGDGGGCLTLNGMARAPL